MRKQDRIASQRQDAPQSPGKQTPPQPGQQEQIKGGPSGNRPTPLQRQPGKLPLPD